TSCATSDGAANCGVTDDAPDVWYKFTPGCNGAYTFRTCGSTYDTVLSIHSACPGTAANQIACNDDSCGLQSEFTATLTAGTTYSIRVSGYLGATGAYTLSWSSPVFPANDTCSNGITIPSAG